MIQTINEATGQRRKAIKLFWKDKSDHLKDNPKDFFKTFKPFLGSKAATKSSDINLKVGENIIKAQTEVAETLADYFATIADDIGERDVELLRENDFKNHPSVLKIAQDSSYEKAVTLKPLTLI